MQEPLPQIIISGPSSQENRNIETCKEEGSADSTQETTQEAAAQMNLRLFKPDKMFKRRRCRTLDFTTLLMKRASWIEFDLTIFML
jgi:hypothetical protein